MVQEKNTKRQRAPTKLVLSNINVDEILLKYFENDCDEDIQETLIGEDVINDMITEKTPKSKKCLYFLDSYKTQIKLWQCMYDFYSQSILPPSTNKPCWWCRRTFTTSPIGCPIRYYYHKDSGIEKERFEEKMSKLNIKIDTNDFFETEGNFCCFPCAKAYILEQLAKTKSCKYKESLSLLSILHSKFFNKIVDIPIATNWKLLNTYGGHLTSKQYNETFGKIEYEELPNTCRPYMYSSATYVKEKKLG